MFHPPRDTVPRDVLSNSSDAIAYPRTGKRGVPQQFPRRLYTMLQSETKDRTMVAESKDKPLIQWSQSGRAFHISDIDLFSSHVLPKYFRTSKFSSFQRNLNLVRNITYTVVCSIYHCLSLDNFLAQQGRHQKIVFCSAML